jgi:hypothetical protein
MEVKASWRFVARSAKAAAPALAAFLVTSAGVAAIAEPIEPRTEFVPRARVVAPPVLAPAASAPVHVATVRIVLPPPAPLTRPRRQKFDESLGFAASRLDSISSDLGTISPAIPKSVPKPAAAPLRMVPDPTDTPQPISASPQMSAPKMSAPQRKAPAAGLAAARGISEADYSAAIRTISASPKPKAIPMVDAESRAALARMNGDDAAAPSRTERLDALQPDSSASPALSMAPARSLAEAAPNAVRPVGMSPIRMQDDDGVSRYHRTAQGLAFDVATTVNGASVGKVSLLIRDGENISIRLADLLAAVQPAIDPGLYQKLSASQAAQSYMTFNELREAGIAVRFNDNDKLILGIK